MAELNSTAEKFAEEATKLPEFRNVNLRGVKDKVAEILDMIGKVEGIFSTYTKHDISHIDSMLRMLDWLVPPEARAVMTSVDWLMAVLAIYLHDLGMVVTSAEFDGRMDNEEFVLFLEHLRKDPDAKDYLARAEAMTEPEKERFFYQEYVREKHAIRVREWITGQHSRFWLKQYRAISSEITSLMSNLPTRFRENLAVVAESHHKNNLDKIDIYPVAQRYGSDPHEIANVQYSAFLLRTVDLIHVTKDRTPSVTYKSVRFSDLKSVSEWDKQRGVWSVNMKGREFNPEDEESHIIEVTADFTEERPFFALAEYIAWADQEIRQTKRWADASQQIPDAKGFGFPWRTIKGDIRVEGNLPRPMRFELDRGRLLDLLVGHTIYNDPTVAVRELSQNAIDAVRFQLHLDNRDASRLTTKPEMGRVLIDWNPETRLLTVEDNGTGMDLGTIENHLLRVGASFYDTPQFQTEHANFTPISRFGIGILTCFMISDNIEIVTCRSGVGRRIRMTSVHADYLLKDLPSGDAQLNGLEPHGTRIKLILRPSVNLKEKSMLDIVRQWIIVPACEVIYSEAGEKPQRIGFDDAEQALQFLISEEEQSQTGNRSLAVMRATFTESDGAAYDLAFAVSTGFIPERLFIVNDRRRSSAVCIEGIRADWHLPGFKPGLNVILAVTGNRRFRTTVSRQSLEIDDEYERVAKLCATWLFKHIEDEVQRISAFPGTPLSQASTAGQWVYDSLTQAATPTVLATLSSLYGEHPLVVLEYSPSDAGSSGTRKLQSINSVASLIQFWTIESRTVDYLGVISRDLGKELNVSSFLGSLAPEQYNPNVSPIVMDPEAFASYLIRSHHVVEVDFSRKHQRTLLRWEKRTNPPQELEPIFRKTTRLQLINWTVEKGISELMTPMARNEEITGVLNSVARVVIVTAVNGDVSDIVAVRTRIVTVLLEGSDAANAWTTIESTLRSSHSSLSVEEQWALLFGLFIIAVATRGRNRYRSIDPDEYAGAWRSIVNDIRAVFTKLKLDKTVPTEWRQVIGKSNWFDASSFWRNWSRFD